MPSKSPPTSPSTSTLSRGRHPKKLFQLEQDEIEATIGKESPKTKRASISISSSDGNADKTSTTSTAELRQRHKPDGDRSSRQSLSNLDLTSATFSTPSSPPLSPSLAPKVPLLRRMSSSLLRTTSRERGVIIIGIAVLVTIVTIWALEGKDAGGAVYRVIRGARYGGNVVELVPPADCIDEDCYDSAF
ncbi:hypothetical protein DFS34DRAFT_624350 [Phlyctochytrium arcticum]|nr:hypothetical protein DFS34DRAFT_624350 [Phlyctochytrium arcticum]